MRSAKAGARGLAAVLLALLAGCGGGREPRWLHLAEGFRPAPVTAGERVGDGPAALELQPAEEPGASFAGATLGRDAWTPAGLPGAWRTTLPFPVTGSPADGSPAVGLAVDGAELVPVATPEAHELANLPQLTAGTFTTVGHDLFLALASDAEPPADARVRVFVPAGAEHAGRWRTALDRYTADGLPVLPGRAVTLRLDVPPASRLLFGAAGLATTPGHGTARFTVTLDGETLLEVDEELGSVASCRWHTVELPAAGRDDAELAFRVAGPPAATAFLSPRLGPAAVGTYAARPFDRRPDLVLFLADTFRADNLATYGGERDLTPNLDAFAAECAVFERAWSPSSWTLPSQASMLTGLQPHQHSATERGARLPSELVTLAERLRASGYRTGAVTDGAFVSRAYGFDEGFEWFDERWDTLDGPDGTLSRARAFLDADDGRPVFLFVQTYRTHTPYTVSPETRRAHGERLGLPEGVDWQTLARETNLAHRDWSQGQPPPESLAASIALQHAFYRGGVMDLDLGFARFLDDLAERGLDESGYLVFTSDHGEAFLEHDHTGHGVGVWEEFVRIPLLLHGPGIAPRRVTEAATLVDLPVTLARLAGVPADDAWGGRGLTDLKEDRTVFAFECRMIAGPTPSMAIIDGDRKVITPSSPEAIARGDVLEAFDLAQDPLERENLGREPWASDVLKDLAPSSPALYRPLAESQTAEVRAEQAAKIKELGYN